MTETSVMYWYYGVVAAAMISLVAVVVYNTRKKPKEQA